MKKKDSIYSAELIIDDLADGLPQIPRRRPCRTTMRQGQAHMVDVSAKSPQAARSNRRGLRGTLPTDVSPRSRTIQRETPSRSRAIAGIQAAKQTSDLIPMCHPLPLSYRRCGSSGSSKAASRSRPRPQPSREPASRWRPWTAASIAALTVYDMTKALDKGIRIREVMLLRKSGGKSGDYRREMI